ncbi:MULTISPECIES: YgdI/YgdR family lipoprotein [unclassified Methylophaga]|uniref:YgdI/YgdR family lipoprotein n=1 Tax=unclassified Methylophaga TaxID=2629249 RepID=UPI000C939045|nr:MULTISPECIES: YgdI/YgdR family lipoprotein [unclassified Methylophaga]MBN47761.1 YgdI/YgdR family lipoprotein [Methylophaga sp.]|tara:strand:- start:146546 stop:146764 length:219 start_codon:yes stop_codon:yes gene_type:complete
MKQSFLTVIFATLFIGLAGCAKDHIIATNDGRMIDSATKPEVNDETGMIEYEDEEGRENQIPVGDVSEIKER